MVSQSSRLPSLDGLRAVSVVLVILSHMQLRLSGPGFDQLWHFSPGALGVWTFFVISGFLITGLLLAEEETNGRIAWRAFYVRRVFRIMPAFLAYLAVMTVLVISGHSPSLALSDIRHAALYIANYAHTSWYVGHSWSLAVEEQFYLIWPGVLVLLGIRRGTRVALAMLLVSPVLRAVAYHWSAWPDNPMYGFECVADGLATGCLLAIYRTRLWSNAWYRRVLTHPLFTFWPLSVLALAIINVSYPALGPIARSGINIMIALGIDWSVRFPSARLGRMLNWRPVAFIGTVSYSLYLWQQPFMAPDNTWPMSVCVLGTVGAALASFYCVERPARDLGRRMQATARRQMSKRIGAIAAT